MQDQEIKEHADISENSEDLYIRCRNCNKWVSEAEVYRGYYCSFPCSVQYRPCPVCGRFYSARDDKPFCSKECAEESNSVLPEKMDLIDASVMEAALS